MDLAYSLTLSGFRNRRDREESGSLVCTRKYEVGVCYGVLFFFVFYFSLFEKFLG